MIHTLFATVNEMLAPEVLSELGAMPVRSVRKIPLQDVEASSGSTFHLVTTNAEQGPSFVLKRLPAGVNGTNDNRHPSVTCWQQGLFHRLPAEIAQVTVACSHDGAGFALLMHDARANLIPKNECLTLVDHALFIEAMAAMHAKFWDDAQLNDPDLGLYRPCHLYPSLPVQTMRTAEGWALFERFVEPDLVGPIQTLLQNPMALCHALERYQSTLVHNDLWWANLGIRREPKPQVIMLDWDFATLGPPAVDLAFYIGENSLLLPATKEEVIAQYRKSLSRRLGARFDDDWWLPQLELGLLGCFLRRGKWLLLASASIEDDSERTQLLSELEWWTEHARIGIQHL
jgi:hypothetical protein